MKYFCKKQQTALQHTNMKKRNIIEKLFGGILNEFTIHDDFTFTIDNLHRVKELNNKRLKKKCLDKECNAPDKDSCGVYIFTMKQDGKEIPIYIGCSGKIQEGKLTPRKGGMRARICNGKQKKQKRIDFYIDIMNTKGINQLKVYWFETGKRDPEYIEYRLILQHISRCHELPEYNNKLVRIEP